MFCFKTDFTQDMQPFIACLKVCAHWLLVADTSFNPLFLKPLIFSDACCFSTFSIQTLFPSTQLSTNTVLNIFMNLICFPLSEFHNHKINDTNTMQIFIHLYNLYLYSTGNLNNTSSTEKMWNYL